ncbi:MAG TPA: ATP-binding protein [Anaeromyxobacteraceae bacterium]|nr:ATP-binding protein [Anaeromyxobacteraceae bacterium]
MLRALGSGARTSAALLALSMLVAALTGVLFLEDVATLEGPLAASAWRTAAVAGVSMAAAAVALGLLLRALWQRNAALAAALSETEKERSARRSELEVIQAVVDSMADGVIFIDASNRIALVNKAGRVLRNLSGGPGSELKDCHPSATHGALDRVMGWLRAGDNTGPAHSIIKEKEGRYETTYAPVRSPSGSYLGTVMVIRDIADRRHLETRLLDAERLAGLGQMSAQIAHELRNPLNAIAGAAQYLARRLPGDPDVAEYSGLISEEVERVNRFVGELLGLSRPVEPVYTPSMVNRVLREAAQKAALARGAPADAVRLDLAKDLPPLDLDAPMVTEAIVNLLGNAFDAGGPPPQLASRLDSDGGESAVVVEVRDRGCGIPEDKLEEVQRPFVTTKTHGTGLGLVIVQRTAGVHRATFQLARREGGGTVAVLRFPVRRLVPTVVEASP